METQQDSEVWEYVARAEEAPKIWAWLQTRGGLAHWDSQDLSNPGACVTTPRLQADGSPTACPGWQYAKTPSHITTDPADVVVAVDAEVRRFRVAIRMGAQGLTLKCSDASSAKIRRAVARAGEGAHHVFDYETQEAIIMRPTSRTPLLAWVEQHPELTQPATK